VLIAIQLLLEKLRTLLNQSQADGIFDYVPNSQEAVKRKVIMLSARSQESNVKLALQLRADGFVVNPFGAQCLIERIG